MIPGLQGTKKSLMKDMFKRQSVHHKKHTQCLGSNQDLSCDKQKRC